MKILLFSLAITAAAIYQNWSSTPSAIEPLYEEPYVVVYGRTSCGFTQQTLKDLKNKDIPFEFQSVDDKAYASLLHSRMKQSGIDTRRYNLPVVDTNGNLSTRPNFSEIITDYN